MGRYFWPLDFSMVSKLTPEQCCERLQTQAGPWYHYSAGAVQGTVSVDGFTIARPHSWGASLSLPSNEFYPVTAQGSFASTAEGTLIAVRLSTSWSMLLLPAVLAVICMFGGAIMAPPPGSTAASGLRLALFSGALAGAIFLFIPFLIWFLVAGSQADFLRQFLCETLDANELPRGGRV